VSFSEKVQIKARARIAVRSWAALCVGVQPGEKSPVACVWRKAPGSRSAAQARNAASGVSEPDRCFRYRAWLRHPLFLGPSEVLSVPSGGPCFSGEAFASRCASFATWLRS